MRADGRWQRFLGTGGMAAAVTVALVGTGAVTASAAADPVTALTTASLNSQTGKLASLKVTTSVINNPIAPDPGLNASVKLRLTATNSDGTPAADAAVTMSNTKPGATFHTNAKGVLTLIEPVRVKPGSSGGTSSVTARVTTSNGTTDSATQELYNASQYASCSYDGTPGPDLSLLESMLPDELSAIQTLIENLGPLLGGYHTNAVGYTITVPKASNIYAQTLIITHRGKTTYSGTGYSRHKILRVGDQLEQIQDGCMAGSGLA
jgi:hypothetical protein